MSDIVDRLERLVILDEVGSNNPLGREAAAEITRLRAEVERVTKDGDEAYELGKRDGYEEAVQDIDVDTGGDGEYRFCTDGDPDRHCPTAAAMKAKIAARFEAAETALSTLRDRVRPLLGKYGEVLEPFLAMMERELHANSGKGDRPGWLAMTREQLLLEIYYHLAKLQKATLKDDAEGISEFAADVANMSMMLVDLCNGLSVDAVRTLYQETTDE